MAWLEYGRCESLIVECVHCYHATAPSVPRVCGVQNDIKYNASTTFVKLKFPSHHLYKSNLNQSMFKIVIMQLSVNKMWIMPPRGVTTRYQAQQQGE